MCSLSHKSQQSGAAAIMFLLMIPVLMGFMTLSIEGGRYLQTKAAVVDAAEVASLVVSATEDVSSNKLAKNYIERLLPDAKLNEVSVEMESSPSFFETEREFVEYQVQVESTHESWFPKWSDDALAFEKEVTITGEASARKYFGASGGLDVVFVPNFSTAKHSCKWDEEKCGSNNWENNIEIIKNAIADVARELEEQSAPGQPNTFALVPFNYVTFESKSPRGAPCLIRQQLESSSVDKTIEKLFTQKGCSTDLAFELSDAAYGSFHTISLTDDADGLITEMEPMKGGWNAASFEGVIRAGQIAAEGTNRNRLIIAISTSHDGNQKLPLSKNGKKDSPDAFHKNLNPKNQNDPEPGYCDLILDNLSTQGTNAIIVGIGFDNNSMGNSPLRNCIIGKDKDRENLVKQIKPKNDEEAREQLSAAMREFIFDFSGDDDFNNYEEIGRIHKI